MGVVTFDWSESAKAKLTELWHAGVTTAQIGQSLGCGKNAVIGKAARLGLPKRAPTRDGGYARTKVVPRPPKPIVLKPARKEPEPVNSGAGLLLTDLTTQSCRWPLWTHGKPDPYEARYCGDAAEPSKPYCAAHRARAIQSGQ